MRRRDHYGSAGLSIRRGVGVFNYAPGTALLLLVMGEPKVSLLISFERRFLLRGLRHLFFIIKDRLVIAE